MNYNLLSRTKKGKFVLNTIKSALELAFPTANIRIEDFSAQHKGHLKGNQTETHLRIIMVYSGFKSLSKLEQQRQVNDILKPFFAQGLHAVELQLSH